jgi:hypothetical protein
MNAGPVLLALLPWLGAALVLALVVYVGGPVLLHATIKLSAAPEVVPFPLDHPSLPPEVAQDFQKVTARLGQDGFEPVGGLALPRQMPQVRAIMLLLANRKAKDVAMATVMYAASAQGPPRRTFYLEVVTSFQDGTVVQTNNASQLPAFGPRPTHTTGRFPTIQCPRELYRLHQELVLRSASSAKKFRLDEEFGGDWRAAVTAGMIEEMEAQVPTGYLYLSPEEKLYRPTWKGAFLMVWKLLWPMKSILRSRRDRAARQLIAQLGIEPPDTDRREGP